MTKKGWNGYNFWPICHRQLTDIPPTINRQRIGQVSAAILTNISGESRSICWPWLSRHLGWYVGRYVGRYVDWHISAVISSRVGQYVDRRIGWVLVDMSTDTSVECRSLCRPIYQSRVHKIHMIHPAYTQEWKISDCGVTRSNLGCSGKKCPVGTPPGGLLSIMDYTGRLCPKGVLFQALGL